MSKRVLPQVPKRTAEERRAANEQSAENLLKNHTGISWASLQINLDRLEITTLCSRYGENLLTANKAYRNASPSNIERILWELGCPTDW